MQILHSVSFIIDINHVYHNPSEADEETQNLAEELIKTNLGTHHFLEFWVIFPGNDLLISIIKLIERNIGTFHSSRNAKTRPHRADLGYPICHPPV